MIGLKDILQMDWKAAIAGIIMFVSVYWIDFSNLFATLLIKIVVGATIYIVILVILKEEIVEEVLVKIKKKK